MVGSIDTLIYTDDNGDRYVIRTDKSNAVLVNGSGNISFPDPADPPPTLPKRFEVRYLLYRDINGRHQRKIPILDVEALPPDNAPNTLEYVTVVGNEAQTINLFKTFYSGEKKPYSLFGDDTGITEPP